MYTLKPPFEINCFQCQTKIVVNFCPPSQKYSNKNNWGYWTEKKENQGKYMCDTCLIDLYRNQKLTYLNSITDSKKRRTFRKYFGGKNALLTNFQRRRVKIQVHDLLRSKEINLTDKDKLGDQLEGWRQTILKLVEENSRQTKKIKKIEKQLAKSQKKPSRNSKK